MSRLALVVAVGCLVLAYLRPYPDSVLWAALGFILALVGLWLLRLED